MRTEAETASSSPSSGNNWLLILWGHLIPQIKTPFPVSLEAWHDHVTKLRSIKSIKVFYGGFKTSLKGNQHTLCPCFNPSSSTLLPGIPCCRFRWWVRPDLTAAEQSPRTSWRRPATLGLTCLSLHLHMSNELLWGLTAYTWWKDSSLMVRMMDQVFDGFIKQLELPRWATSGFLATWRK